VTACCPTCGQKIVSQIELEGLPDAFIRNRRKIVEYLVIKHPTPVTIGQLVTYVYQDDIDGGPLQPENSMTTTINKLRPVLKQYGWTIPKSKGGPGNWGLYRLERVREKDLAQ